jgi:hypothetical protein
MSWSNENIAIRVVFVRYDYFNLIILIIDYDQAKGKRIAKSYMYQIKILFVNTYEHERIASLPD